jgi:hypothetical protein
VLARVEATSEAQREGPPPVAGRRDILGSVHEFSSAFRRAQTEQGSRLAPIALTW